MTIDAWFTIGHVKAPEANLPAEVLLTIITGPCEVNAVQLWVLTTPQVGLINGEINVTARLFGIYRPVLLMDDAAIRSRKL